MAAASQEPVGRLDGYILYPNQNAYGYPVPCGAIEVEDKGYDGAQLNVTSAHDCKEICSRSLLCDCAVWAFDRARCWRRHRCSPQDFCSDFSEGFNVYVKVSDCTGYADWNGNVSGCVCRKGRVSRKFSSDLQTCELCPAGKYVAGGASGQCEPCLPWLSSVAGSTRCVLNHAYILNFVSFAILLFAVSLFPFMKLGLQIRIVDVSLQNGKLIATTLGPHRVHVWRGDSTPVGVSGTGHPGLDGKKLFRARVLDHERLELLDAAGEAIEESMDTSTGSLRQPFPVGLLDTGRKCPTCFPTLAMLTVTVFLAVFGNLPPDAEAAAAAAGLLLALAISAHRRRRHSTRRTQLQERLLQYRDHIVATNPRPRPCSRGPHRAVTSGQLGTLFSLFSDFILDRNMYYVSSNLIKPLTAESQLSFAELVGPTEVMFFVSHFWGNSFRHLVESILQHSRAANGNDCPEAGYWICSLSNNQWSLAEEVGCGHWQDSSFYKALRSGRCRATCMILDTCAMPLTRSWCLFEVWQTFNLAEEDPDFQGLLFCTPAGVMNSGAAGYDVALTLARKLSSLRLQDATASMRQDKETIDNLIVEHGGFDCMNEFIRSNMKAALQIVKRNFECDFNELEAALGAEVAPKPLRRLPGFSGSSALGLHADMGDEV